MTTTPHMIHEPTRFTLNQLASKVYTIATAHGFHKGEYIGGQTVERMAAFVANLHGEVSELWEAVRKNKLFLQCDKPIPMNCAEEELADIVIRALDTAASLGIDIGRAVQIKSAYNETRPYMHGKAA